MKIKWGMYITDGVGKLGGHVIQRNAYGSFVRTLVVPFNPQSAFQQDRRAQHEFLTQNWRALSVGEQNAWRADTINYPRTDALGNTIYLTPINHYISLNLNLWLIGQAFITTPGVKRIPASVTPFSCAVLADGSSASIRLVPPPADVNSLFVVYVTDGISPGINYVSTKYRSCYVGTPDAVTVNFVFTTEYFALFPLPPVNNKVFMKVISFDLLSGCPNLPQFITCLVT